MEEKASAIAKRKVLESIQHDAEMELYFGIKIMHTPIEQSAEDRKREFMYTGRRLDNEALAKRMGIPKEEIEEARNKGFDRANEAATEADQNGGWE